MGLTEEELIKKFARHPNDVGSPEIKYIKLSFKREKVMKHYKSIGKNDKQAVRHAMSISNKMSGLTSYLRKALPNKYKKIKKFI